MLSDNVIEFKNVSKKYKIGSFNPIKRIFGKNGDSKGESDYSALTDISFSVKRGATLGIIGPNGAGKSTILKLIAGVTYSDSGTIKVEGRISPLIELGAGFHPELTGRENIYLNSALLGLSKVEINEKFDEIVEFAELWDFIDTPVKKYSSGMFVKLGFSVAVHTSPDILLVDEVLSVGDERFQRKSLKKIIEFKKAGKTIVFVSHDLGLISNVCDDVMLISVGKLIEYGSIDNAVSHYLQMIMGDVEGSAVIKTEQMNFIFSNGKASLFWNGRELTKKWGFYTSMLIGRSKDSQHFWHDSTKALWTCSSINASHINCRGEFISVPIVQEWDLKVTDAGKIVWKVELEVKEPFFFERRQANIMLSEKYTEWTDGELEGGFPEDFTSRDYHNWDILNSSNTCIMQAESKAFYPKIEFRTSDKELVGAVVNSSFFFGGRVLMYLNMESSIIPAGQYQYFHGEININS